MRRTRQTLVFNLCQLPSVQINTVFIFRAVLCVIVTTRIVRGPLHFSRAFHIYAIDQRLEDLICPQWSCVNPVEKLGDPKETQMPFLVEMKPSSGQFNGAGVQRISHSRRSARRYRLFKSMRHIPAASIGGSLYTRD